MMPSLASLRGVRPYFRICVACCDSVPAERSHSFTERRELRDAWIARLSATDAEAERIKKELSTRTRPAICDAHFDEDAYEPGTAILRKNALPIGPAGVKREVSEVQATNDSSRPTEIKLEEPEPSTSRSLYQSRNAPPVREPPVVVDSVHPCASKSRTLISRPIVRRIVIKRRHALSSSASSSYLNGKTVPPSLRPQEKPAGGDSRNSNVKPVFFGVNPGCAFSCLLCAESSPHLLTCFPTDEKLEQKWLESISADYWLRNRFMKAVRTGAYFRTLICVRHFRPRELGLANGRFFRIFNAVPDSEVRSIEVSKRYIREYGFPAPFELVDPLAKNITEPSSRHRAQIHHNTDGASLSFLNSLSIDWSQTVAKNVKMHECVICKDRVPATHSTVFTIGANQELWLTRLSRDEQERKRLKTAMSRFSHLTFKSHHFLCLRHFRPEDLELKNGRVVRSQIAVPDRESRCFLSMVRSLAEKHGMAPEFATIYCSHPDKGGELRVGEVVSSPPESAGVQIAPPQEQGSMDAPPTPEHEVKEGAVLDRPLTAVTSARFDDAIPAKVPKEEIKEEQSS